MASLVDRPDQARAVPGIWPTTKNVPSMLRWFNSSRIQSVAHDTRCVDLLQIRAMLSPTAASMRSCSSTSKLRTIGRDFPLPVVRLDCPSTRPVSNRSRDSSPITSDVTRVFKNSGRCPGKWRSGHYLTGVSANLLDPAFGCMYTVGVANIQNWTGNGIT